MKSIILPQKECIREHPKPQYFLRASASTARRGSLYGAKASVSGSRCNLLREDSGLRKQKIHRTLNEFCGSFYLSLFTQFRLVVDQLIFVAPAVQFSDFFSNLFSLMLCSFLSHSLEVYLTSCR